MNFTEQVTNSWLFLAKIHFASGGNVEAHFVFNICYIYAIALTNRASFKIKHEFWNQEE